MENRNNISVDEKLKSLKNKKFIRKGNIAKAFASLNEKLENYLTSM